MNITDAIGKERQNSTGRNRTTRCRHFAKTFAHTQSNKTVGFYRVAKRPLKSRKKQLTQEFCSLLNWIISTGKRSKKWELANMIVMYKDNGEAKNAPNYWSISQLSSGVTLSLHTTRYCSGAENAASSSSFSHKPSKTDLFNGNRERNESCKGIKTQKEDSEDCQAICGPSADGKHVPNGGKHLRLTEKLFDEARHGNLYKPRTASRKNHRCQSPTRCRLILPPFAGFSSFSVTKKRPG